MSEAHVAVVLAAGGSSRLGRPKQLLTRDGETLVHRALRLVSTTSPSRMLVVVGAWSDQVIDALADSACEIVHNADWQRGLATSLHAVAESLGSFNGPVLVIGCDQPALDSEHLRTLLIHAHSAPSRVAVTRYGDVSGVPVVVPAAWFWQDGIVGDQGFGPLLRALPATALGAIDAPELGFDIDTPEDAAAAAARGWLDASAVGSATGAVLTRGTS